MKIMLLSMPLEDIMKQIDENEIDDSLDFQRNYVWSKKKQKDLITTYKVRKGFGIISFCRSRTVTRWGILDGKQRLTTFGRFLNNEFADNEGLKFEQWTEGDKVRLQSYQINILSYTLEANENDSDLVEQFVLLNNGGQKLVESELIYASDSPVVQKATDFFHSPLGSDGFDETAERLRTRWCETFRSPEQFTKDPLVASLKRICANHTLDTSGRKNDLLERIRENTEALQELNTIRSDLNDGRIPVSEQDRKQQYAVTVPMIASACLNEVNAITGSFNKLKESGAFGRAVLSNAGLDRFYNCLDPFLDLVMMMREIDMPQTYQIKAKNGIPKATFTAIGWSLILEATNQEDIDNDFHTQCTSLFDNGNFAPLRAFYTKLNISTPEALRWRFDLECSKNRGSMKIYITNIIKFIHQNCE